MKHSILTSVACKVMVITINLLLVLSYEVTAQNTSYNVNSIPIGGVNNCAFGFNALFSNTGTANSNVAVGNSALYSNAMGRQNTAIGFFALYNNTSIANSNTAVGYRSLYTNAALGASNTGLGASSDVASSSLVNATAIGYGAIVNASNTMQLGNSSLTAIYAGTGTNAKLIAGGLQIAGGSIAIGNVLTSDAFGNATWQTPSGGSSWSLIGNFGTIDGTNFIGTTDNVPFNIRVNNQKAGRIDPSLLNTFYGLAAGNSNTTGTGNSATGYNALFSNTNGSYNTANGYEALYSNTTASYNVAYGYGALKNNTSGSINIAVGYEALKNNTTGGYNVGVGVGALLSNTTGIDNVAVGAGALQSNTTGDDNTAFGQGALAANTTGLTNVAVGFISLWNNTTGGVNTAVGYDALAQNTTGDLNTAIGFAADMNAGSYSNVTMLGSGAQGTGSNMVRVGNGSVTSIGGYANWSNISDKRVKRNIKANVPGLDFINKLNPVTYNLDLESSDRIIQLPKRMNKSGKIIQLSTEELIARKQKENITYTGFIAQDVEKAAKELNYDFSGVDVPKNDKDLYGLRYSEFVVPLVKAVQELSSENDELKTQLNMLSKRLAALELAQQENSKIKSSQNEIINDLASLEQNAPNPFINNTVIRYNIPVKTNNAQIVITDVNGITLKTISLNNKGLGQVVITAGTLISGSYIYSLIVDGKKADSKQMVLTK